MAKQGDTTRARRIKVEFDDSVSSTSFGGASLIERAFRRLGLRRALAAELPPRKGSYSSPMIAERTIAGLLCGGRGFQATAPLCEDGALRRIFGYGSAGSGETVYRAMCDLAGLPQRDAKDVYAPAQECLPSLDMFGDEKKQPLLKRSVPSVPERMREENRAAMVKTLQSVSRRCIEVLGRKDLSLAGFVPVHGDATDLEVRGKCFDAARLNHEGNLSLRLGTVTAGPVYAAAQVMEGASDEGRALPALLEQAAPVVSAAAGRRRVLALLDAAYAESQVMDALGRLKWRYIIGGNQWRDPLARKAEELGEEEWRDGGQDAGRGWSASQTAVFAWRFEGWPRVTAVARRWKETGSLDIDAWRYAFVITDLEPRDLPRKWLERYGYAQSIWMLYGTKQGQENNYKRLLSDLGQHHPPSGRLGATQAFAYISAMAANIAAVLTHRVAKGADRRMRWWRFVRDYVCMPGKITMQAGRTLLVTLAGGGYERERKTRWLEAFASAGRL